MSEVWLGLDTCTPYLCLALWSADEGVLDTRVELVGRNHSARLVPALEESLRRAGVERRSLGAIAAGRGPGSYTGTRIGGAAAKGLAGALGIPLGGCDTLAAIAFGGMAHGEEGLAGLDARRGNVYLGRYRREGDVIDTLQAPSKVSLELVREEFPNLKIILDAAPDPVYIARTAGSVSPYQPLYL